MSVLFLSLCLLGKVEMQPACFIALCMSTWCSPSSKGQDRASPQCSFFWDYRLQPGCLLAHHRHQQVQSNETSHHWLCYLLSKGLPGSAQVSPQGLMKVKALSPALVRLYERDNMVRDHSRRRQKGQCCTVACSLQSM